ncbi:YtzI protein [Virgibacillus dakarensis]|nr:YtzI protein [Virgibacillus dakarensis]MTW85558.1 YtzI protein [Virgibacillus dakarensis]
MLFYILVAIAIILIILVLTLVSISKGYAYKHTIDPLPEEDLDNKNQIVNE